MKFENPSPQAIRDLLSRIKTIAILGLSPKPNRPSFFVAKMMQSFGYRIIPVRPATNEVLGVKACASLSELPEPVDLVDVFRASEYLDEVVDECIRLKVPAIWIQEGIVNEAAAKRAQEAGIFVVMDRCIYKDYASLMA